jgi:hypothetical protein
MAKENCVICGSETNVDITTHVDMRTGYIDGLGQMCIPCHLKGTNRDNFTVPSYYVNLFPNDQELGSKVRNHFHSLFSKK